MPTLMEKLELAWYALVLPKLQRALRHHPFATLAASNVATAAVLLWAAGPRARAAVRRWLTSRIFNALTKNSLVAGAIAKETGKVLDGMRSELAEREDEYAGEPEDEGEAAAAELTLALPEKGIAVDTLRSLMERWSTADKKLWGSGRVSGGIYHGGEDLSDLIAFAFRRFTVSNPLHPEVFPAVRRMESELVAMTINMFAGHPVGAVGTTTAGGTESILMACKAAREWGKARGLDSWEIVAPASAHAAFNKACGYFGMTLVSVPVDPHTFSADVAAMKAAITPATVMLVGSAPTYPQGIVDDIPSIAALAKSRGLLCHVDACLGGYLIPWLKPLGYELPAFDFSVPGVTSISADTHKYGFAPKGVSVVMYRTRELCHHQYFAAPDWMGGIYATATVAGSRPGALLAAAWAVMKHMGADGYRASAERIMAAADSLKAGIAEIEGIELCGCPQASVVAFQSDELNIYNVSDALSKRGWSLNALQKPAGLHIALTWANAGSVDKLLADLAESVTEVRTHPERFKGGSSAIYGMKGSIPDPSLTESLCAGFLDLLFQADLSKSV